MKNNSLPEYKILLTTLISLLTITGIGFIDNKIWNIIFAIIGVVTYGIVSLLYSLHILSSKKAGKDAYAIVFIVLIIIGFYIYNGIVEFQKWLISWALWCKILIPSLFVICIVVVVILMILKQNKERAE